MKKNYILIYTTLLLLMSNCVSTEGTLGSADYNQRQKIRDPHYTIKRKPVGTTLVVIGGLAGGIVGSQQDIVSYYDGTERKSMTAGNMAVGALIGLGTTTLLSKIFKLNYNSTKPVNTEPEIKDWLKKKNIRLNDYQIISRSYGATYIIPNRMESNYSVNNLQDVRDFKEAFPNSTSSNRNRMLDKAINNLNRKDLPALARIYPTRNSDIGMRYLQLSSSNSELAEVGKHFPALKDKATRQAYLKVYTIGTAKKFKQYFPYATDYHNQIIDNLHTGIPKRDLESLIKLFPNASSISKAKNHLAKVNAKIKREIENGTFTGNASHKFWNGTYDGYIKNGKKHGYGTMNYNNGKKYKGDWKYGKENGQGTLYYASNDKYKRSKYEGQFNSGNRQGEGTLYWKSGTYYKGDFENDVINGFGEQHWTGDGWYKGQWKDGEKHGSGEYRDAGGYGAYRYKGVWKEGKREGQFKVTRWTGNDLIGKNEYFAYVEYKNGVEISRSVIKDDFSKPSNSYSYNNSGYDNNKKENNQPKNTGGYSKEDLRNGNVNVPNYRKGKQIEGQYTLMKEYVLWNINFDGGVSGTLYKEKETGKYFISAGDFRIYYRDEGTTIKALYIHRKHNVVMKK